VLLRSIVKGILTFTIAFGLLSIGISSCNNGNKTASENTTEKAVYQCPMDCEKGKTYEQAGQCSVFGMDLEKVKKTATSDSVHVVN
jgi:hypothetical protein